MPLTDNKIVLNWIDEMASMTKPDNIVWIDGSEEQRKKLADEACSAGEIEELNQEKLPGCYYHRTNPNDVARVEHLTFICTKEKESAGPLNNWMETHEAYEKVSKVFEGAMKGRTMYVVPFLMGPYGSPFSKIGIELTDSIYVVLNMRIMCRIGQQVLDQLGHSDDFTRCLHGKADINPERRYIAHFPEDNAIWSVGSGYGGNVLLGKKCLALRIASYLGKQEGWMAEHMLILGIENPEGETKYVAAAFPSACGKTNLAMLVPPKSMKGYKIWTVGDDIAWIRIGEDGRLWAANPEAGFFGVAPGTGAKTNPNALATVQKNTIFTNVVKTEDKTVWWEGMGEPPAKGEDWKGRPWTPDSPEPGAHPNSRFTAPACQCPSISPEWEKPQGVPLDAIIFGGRRAKVAPLVYESFNWQHGTYVGSTMASETTAAAIGLSGVRRDPMAMKPFAGYNIGDYLQHWLDMGKKIKNPPKIFHVNWFKTNEEGKFIWPGFGENLRVLDWIIKRCSNKVQADETPIGFTPTKDSLETKDLVDEETMEKLLQINADDWDEELKGQAEFFESMGPIIPQEILAELDKTKERFKN